MRPIGFSTGALACGDFESALRMLRAPVYTACELSALREEELAPLLAALGRLDLARFRYVAIHAPSRLERLAEADVVRALSSEAARELPVVCHPNVLATPETWRPLGRRLLIENMDKRKPIGRTVAELAPLFEALPDAGFCFDLGHARQVDPTMTVASELLDAFGDRLRQLHVSEVNSSNVHEALGLPAISSFRKIARRIPAGVPLILETPVGADALESELSHALVALGGTDEIPMRSGQHLGGCPAPTIWRR